MRKSHFIQERRRDLVTGESYDAITRIQLELRQWGRQVRVDNYDRAGRPVTTRFFAFDTEEGREELAELGVPRDVLVHQLEERA